MNAMSILRMLDKKGQPSFPSSLSTDKVETCLSKYNNGNPSTIRTPRIGCKFAAQYVDQQTHEVRKYVCDEVESKINGGDGYCIFHSHATKHVGRGMQAKAEELFLEKVHNTVLRSKPLMCIGYRFPFEIRISEKFLAPVYFNDAIFEEEVDFTSSRFQAADFTRARFAKDAYFDSCTFFSDVRFEDAEFLGKARFSGSVFQPRLGNGKYFAGTTFTNSFERARFHNRAEFADIRVNGRIKFTASRFYEVCDFSNIVVIDAYNNCRREAETYAAADLSMRNTRFDKAAIFSTTHFHCSVDLQEAVFLTDAFFDKTEFHKTASFRDTHFHKAIFVGSKFRHTADFAKVVSEETDFSKAQFKRSADFAETELGRASFAGAILSWQGSSPNSAKDLARSLGANRMSAHILAKTKRISRIVMKVNTLTAGFVPTGLFFFCLNSFMPELLDEKSGEMALGWAILWMAGLVVWASTRGRQDECEYVYLFED